MKSLVTGLAAAAALALAAAAPASAQQSNTRIIVVSHGQANDPFWSVVKNGVQAAGKDMNVQVDYRAPETFDMVGPSIKKAVAAGIPVISMNSGSDVSKSLGALLHVGQDELDAGKAAGAKLKEMGGKTGLCVNHEVGNVALDLRCKGFAEGFGGKVTVLPVSNDPTEIRAKVKAALSSDSSIDTVLALGAALAGEPTVAAVKEMGKTGSVRVASFDMSPSFLKSVAAGDAAFAIDQQQYLQGYLPVVFLALNAKYGLVPGGNVPSGPNLITKDKANQVVELAAKGIR
jgi:simple sugar transport system substrate-binding protein